MFPVRTLLILGLGLALLGGAGYTGYAVWSRSRPIHRAEQSIAAGRLREALVDLRTVSRDEPRNGVAAMMMATVHEQLGDIASAERDLKRARSLGVDRWEIIGRLGPYYLSQRRFRELLAETPSSGPDPAIRARNLAFRSRAYVGLSDLPRAEETLAEAQRAQAENAEVKVATARLALARHETGPAEAAIDTALALDPRNLEALQVKFNMLAAKGDVEAAKTMADRAVAAAPGAVSPLLDRAGLLLALGRDTAARSDIDAVLRAQPRNATAVYLDGVLSVHEQRFGEASDKLSTLGDIGGRFARTSYFQALAALNRNLPATAVEMADHYLSRNPDDPDGIRLMARAQAANRRPDLARETLKDAVARGIDDAQTLDQLGTTLAILGDTPGALSAFSAALAKAPEQTLIRIHIADLKVRSGDPGGAVRELERTTQTAQASAAATGAVLQARAVAQIAAGQADAAAATIQALRAAGGDTEATGNLTGMLALARLDVEGAVSAFRATQRLYPDSVTVALNLARALTASGKRMEARAAIAAVLERDPRNPAALSSFVQLCAADGQFPPAIRVLDAARAAAPGDDGVLAMLSDVALRMGDSSRAMATITRNRAPESRKLVTWAALGRAQAEAGQLDEAETSFRRALEDRPDMQTALDMASLQAKTGNRSGAAATLDSAIKQLPSEFDLLTRRVQLETEGGGTAQGLAKAATLRADPMQMPAAALLAGDLLMRNGRAAEAARAYRTEWEAAPTTPLAERLAEAQLLAGDEAGALAVMRTVPGEPGAALLMSQLDIRAQRWPEAARNIELALTARGNDPALLNNLAFVYQRLSDPRARPAAQRAYLLSPSADNGDTLGWILVVQGAAKEAVPILRAANSQRPDDPLIAYHLAVALDGDGNAKAALPLLTAALAQPAPFDGRPEAQALLARLKGRP